ncbi:MAG TPA: type 4a pilus biogenesis protein PilO [Patescibacteria group bacterium]|nr:type 4a pilus biogenesis protein PilO [Patescibacteria group bacterium]
MSLKQRLITFTLILTATVLVIGLGIIFPTIRQVKRINAEAASIEAELEARYRNSQKLKQTLHELPLIRTKVEEIEKALAQTGDELALITELENLATRNSVNQSLKISTSQEKDHSLFILSFITSGQYPDLVRYLAEIERLPYYVIIKEVKLEKKGEAQGSFLTLSFTGKVYVEN